MSKRYTSWSLSEIDRLRELTATCGSWDEVVSQMEGRDYAQVTSCCSNYGIGSPRRSRKEKWSDEDDSKLKELWGTELTIDEIADKVGRTVESVKARAKKMRREGEDIADRRYLNRIGGRNGR